jgi:putative phage-type endonuclease
MALTAKQLEDRKAWLGASDMAAVLGLDPYRTPYEVWADKTGRAPAREGGERAKYGTMIEPVLRAWASAKLERPVVASTSTFRHMSVPCMAVNPDGFVGKCQRGNPLVECKRTSLAQEWGEPGTDQVPYRTIVQVQTQMACTASPHVHVVADIADRFHEGPEMYIVHRDNEMIAMIEERAVEFWNLIANDTPPEDGPVPPVEFIAKVRRDTVDPAQVDDAIIAEYQAANERRKKAEKEEEEIKARLLLKLGTSEIGESEMHIVKYVMENAGSNTDMAAIRQNHPEQFEAWQQLIDRYQVKRTRRVLRIKARK